MPLLLPDEQMKKFPLTRYMGSKRKLINDIWAVSRDLEFNSVTDLFSGSGVVSYMYKCHGKRVVSCDFMYMNAVLAKAMVENNRTMLSDKKVAELIQDNGTDDFVANTFSGIFYSDEDNHQIDVLRCNIKSIDDEYEHAIAMAALIRACTKKRPRGIFTYTGLRYNDGRKDLRLSVFEQFEKAVHDINAAVFSNGKRNRAEQGDSLSLKANTDLVYIDPPYYNPTSDNDYVRRYHFIEGLARDWNGVEIDMKTKTHKFPSYKSQFSTKDGAYKAFDEIFRRYRNKYIVVSYSSNSLPTKDEMLKLMRKYKNDVSVYPIEYRYHFANQEINTHNRVQEYLFVGR